ncbi:MAG: Maf family protein [Hyphomicrobiales bacterium]|nr:Maf family protein [Hyphomicrobiales bacterium]MDE2114127.1 Maf family protein [Hyphomicrobiales bacterium]
MADHPLVLASRSSARRALLQGAGLQPILASPEVDERALEAKLLSQNPTPETLARHLALAKARAVSARFPGHWVLGADQVMSLDGAIFHKPVDLSTAARQLRQLAGKTHHLHAAVSLVRDGQEVFGSCDKASLSMRALSEPFLTAYLAMAGETILQSVGGYQLEGLGVHLFDAISGAHDTILGLPLLPLLAFWRKSGALLQ